MTTTPTEPPPERSSSRSRPPHHPTTPLRPPSRTSLRLTSGTGATPTHGGGGGGGSSSNGGGGSGGGGGGASTALDGLEPAFAELTDSLADLEANFLHLQLLHESVARFSENFAAFLYGLNMSAFCVDFPEAPSGDAFGRFADKVPQHQHQQQQRQGGGGKDEGAHHGARPDGLTGRKADPDHTFLTTDTSFVNDPPASVRVGRYATPGAGRGGTSAGSGTRGGRGRGIPSRGGAGAGVGAGGASRGSAASRGSGIGRGRVRGTR